MRLIDDEVRNFFSAGLLRPIDIVFAGGFFTACVTVVYWRIFGSPSAEQLVVVLLTTIAYFQMWLLVLLLRIGVIVLRARADINMMPEAAARLAVSALTPSMAAQRPAAPPVARAPSGLS